LKWLYTSNNTCYITYSRSLSNTIFMASKKNLKSKVLGKGLFLRSNALKNSSIKSKVAKRVSVSLILVFFSRITTNILSSFSLTSKFTQQLRNLLLSMLIFVAFISTKKACNNRLYPGKYCHLMYLLSADTYSIYLAKLERKV